MRHVRPALLAALACGLPLIPAAATAEPPASSGIHSVSVYSDAPFPQPGDDPHSYWNLVGLDGMCGFPAATLTLSNMSETFTTNTHLRGAAAGNSEGVGKLLDEDFTLTEYDSAGAAVRVYRGLGDEYAQFRSSDYEQGANVSVNLRAVFRGASDDGRVLRFVITARLRTDPLTGELRKFDAGLDSCSVR